MLEKLQEIQKEKCKKVKECKNCTYKDFCLLIGSTIESAFLAGAYYQRISKKVIDKDFDFGELKNDDR